MASKSKKQNAQSQARKRKRKEEKRRKKKMTAAKLKTARRSIGQRQQQQLKSLVPVAWIGENQIDVAVFDAAAFANLNAEQQNEVACVKESLRLIECGKPDQASEAVGTIPRKSELSDWRLLIRGITSWLDNDLTAADTTWSRLDIARRPARIARALQLAHREDLTELAAGKVTSPDPTGGSISQAETTVVVPPPDHELLKAARIVRRRRIDRAAIKIATAGLNQKLEYEDEIPDSTITPKKIQWLREFSNDFRDLEPNLVRAIEIAALDRAADQPYTDVFDETINAFRGPAHDPRNLFRAFQYWLQDEDDENPAHAFLHEYVTNDLPSNEQLSKPLRNAMISTIWLKEAAFELEQLIAARSPFGFAYLGDLNGKPTQKSIRDKFRKSIKAYPLNEPAHKAYVESLKQDAKGEDLTKKQRDQATKQLTEAMKEWSKAIPAAPQPHTYLAETLLEAEQFEDAAPHIQWIINSRPEDPRLRILPWKSKLFEAMNLCRRKSNLSLVPGVLAEVESMWPRWLSAKWLPYFTAAWLLRSGDQTEFQKHREIIYSSGAVTRDSLADACMMLGAAQTMKVPAADLKPLRQPIDLAVKNVKQLNTDELLSAGSFFWAMYKAKVFYPAFRMHGSKFGRELLNRFKSDSRLLKKHINEPQFQQSVFWFSEHRFWGDGYESKMPPSFRKLVTKDKCMAAAHLNGQIKIRFGVRNEQLLETSQFLREAIRGESDPFYRFWFAELASAAEEKYHQFEAENEFEGFGEMFGRMFGQFSEDNGECDCETCRAKRAHASARGKQAKTPEQEESKQKEDDCQASLF